MALVGMAVNPAFLMAVVGDAAAAVVVLAEQ
jgi:hypothetical protein